MRKKRAKLSTGSFLAIILSLLIGIACIWMLPKLFGGSKDMIQTEKDTNTLSKFVTFPVTTTPTSLTPAEKIQQNNIVTLPLLFAGIVNYNKKVQDSTLNENGIIQSTFIFDYVKSYLDARYSVANIMNTFIKTADFNDLNAPDDILFSLKQNGFKLLEAGGRNLLNKGVIGLDSILDAGQQYEININGINTKKAEIPIFIENINNVPVAFLQFSQSITRAGIYALNNTDISRYINVISEELVKKEIARAKEYGAKIIIVNIHWNNESDPRINDYQKNAVHMIANAGADLIIGSNLTSPQGFEVITAFNSDGSKRNVPVVYSLGTLLNSDRSKIARTCSILLQTDIQYDFQKKSIVSMHFDYTPLYLWKNKVNNKETYVVLDAELPAISGMSDDQKENMNKANAFLRETFLSLPALITFE